MTILTNDDAHGEFSFDANSVSVVIEESGAIPTAANGKSFPVPDYVYDATYYMSIASHTVAELRVVRRGGVIGEVTIPFELELAGVAGE